MHADQDIETVIEPRRTLSLQSMSEIYKYRELLLFLVWRDLKIRYAQAVLGAAWAFLQPVISVAVLTVVLGKLANVPSDGVPYAVFCMAGLLPWGYFVQAVTTASGSLTTNQNLVEKVYFPRLLLPLASVVSASVDLFISLLALFVLMLAYGVTPGVSSLLALPFLLLTALAAVGLGTLLASLNVLYRDIKYITPFVLQIWFFATPVIYPASLVSEPWRPLLGINPMAGAVEMFRVVALGLGDPPLLMLTISIIATGILLAAGLVTFAKLERSFSDVI